MIFLLFVYISNVKDEKGCNSHMESIITVNVYGWMRSCLNPVHLYRTNIYLNYEWKLWPTDYPVLVHLKTPLQSWTTPFSDL